MGVVIDWLSQQYYGLELAYWLALVFIIVIIGLTAVGISRLDKYKILYIIVAIVGFVLFMRTVFNIDVIGIFTPLRERIGFIASTTIAFKNDMNAKTLVSHTGRNLIALIALICAILWAIAYYNVYGLYDVINANLAYMQFALAVIVSAATIYVLATRR